MATLPFFLIIFIGCGYAAIYSEKANGGMHELIFSMIKYRKTTFNISYDFAQTKLTNRHTVKMAIQVPAR